MHVIVHKETGKTMCCASFKIDSITKGKNHTKIVHRHSTINHTLTLLTNLSEILTGCLFLQCNRVMVLLL